MTRHPTKGWRRGHRHQACCEELRRSATIKKGARITGAARDKLAADLRKKYEKGQSIRALAEGTGRSYGFVHRLLLDAEVPLRGRGGPPAPRRSDAGPAGPTAGASRTQHQDRR